MYEIIILVGLAKANDHFDQPWFLAGLYGVTIFILATIFPSSSHSLGETIPGILFAVAIAGILLKILHQYQDNVVAWLGIIGIGSLLVFSAPRLIIDNSEVFSGSKLAACEILTPEEAKTALGEDVEHVLFEGENEGHCFYSSTQSKARYISLNYTYISEKKKIPQSSEEYKKKRYGLRTSLTSSTRKDAIPLEDLGDMAFWNPNTSRNNVLEVYWNRYHIDIGGNMNLESAKYLAQLALENF